MTTATWQQQALRWRELGDSLVMEATLVALTSLAKRDEGARGMVKSYAETGDQVAPDGPLAGRGETSHAHGGRAPPSEGVEKSWLEAEPREGLDDFFTPSLPTGARERAVPPTISVVCCGGQRGGGSPW